MRDRCRVLLSLLSVFGGASLHAVTVATPILSPAGGKFNNPVRVSMTCSTSQAEIRYTLDASDPTVSSKRYSGPVEIAGTLTLKARAFKSGMTTSAPATKTFDFVVATPTLSRSAGWFVGSVDTRPSSKTDAAALRYTTDGSDPTESSKRYLGLTDFTFREKTTFKVKGFADKYTSSPTVSATYTPATIVLLHGLNSGVETWATVMGNIMLPRGEVCPVLTLTGNVPKANCYRYGFQSKTVGGISWSNGDGETFSELGNEVKIVVEKIAKANDPALVVLVGHSRGGLAARAYLQSIPTPATPKYKLALLTIGTPHLGSPLGRIKWWLDDRNKQYSWVNVPFKFLYSPSTGYLATWHSKSAPPATRKPAIWELNGNVNLLGRVASFGEIVSSGMGLGENVYLRLNVFDGAKLGSWPLGISKTDLTQMKEYVFLDLPSDWGTDGDGVVPLAAQKLENVSGLPRSFSTQQTKLTRVAHVDETSEAAAISAILEKMLPSVAAPAALAPTEAKRSFEEPTVFERDLFVAAQRLERVPAQSLVAELRNAIEHEDNASLVASEELLVRRGVEEFAVVSAMREALAAPNGLTSAEIVTLLGRIASPDAVRVLVDSVNSTEAPLVRVRAAEALSHLGTWVRPADVRSVDGLLINAVNRAADDLAFAAAANGLGDLGTRDGASLLWRYAREGAGRRSELADAALRGPARSPEVVAVLAAELQGDVALRTRSATLAGDILATIVSPEATSVLLNWSRATPAEQFALYAVPWLSNSRDSVSIALVESAAKSPYLADDRRATFSRIVNDRMREITPRTVRIGE